MLYYCVPNSCRARLQKKQVSRYFSFFPPLILILCSSLPLPIIQYTYFPRHLVVPIPVLLAEKDKMNQTQAALQALPSDLITKLCRSKVTRLSVSLCSIDMISWSSSLLRSYQRPNVVVHRSSCRSISPKFLLLIVYAKTRPSSLC